MSGRTKKQKHPSAAKSKKMKSRNTAPAKSGFDTVSQVEDGVMKVMMEFFSKEMLPLFGITTKATGVLATEEVQIKLSKGYEDFNLEMEDGSIAHFEFQSSNGGTDDLRRFRSYESSLSYKLKRPVITYVLFSGHVMHPMTEHVDGINPYKIVQSL